MKISFLLPLAIAIAFSINQSVGQEIVFQKEIMINDKNIMNFGDQPNYYLLKDSSSSDFTLYASDRLSSAIVSIDTSSNSYRSTIIHNKGQDANRSGLITYNQNKIRKLARKNLADSRSFVFEEIDTEMGLRAQNNQALKVPSNEFILGYLFKDKKYFVLTLTKRSSNFNLYEVSLNSNTKSSIDMSSADIRPFKNISDLLKDEGFEASYIDRRLPNSLFDVHDEIKYYLDKDFLTVTFDNQPYETIFFELDLINLSGRATKIKKDYVSCTELKSNSYLFEGHLYSLRGCEKNVVFSIKDVRNDSLIYKEVLYNDQPLPEGYSDLYSEGFFNPLSFKFAKRGTNDIEEINKDFYRQIRLFGVDLSLSAYRINENIRVDLGYCKSTTTTEPVLMGRTRWDEEYISYFSTTFDSNFNLIDSLSVATSAMKIKEDIEEKRMPKNEWLQLINLFLDSDKRINPSYLMSNGKYFLGFFNKKTKEYMVIAL